MRLALLLSLVTVAHAQEDGGSPAPSPTGCTRAISDENAQKFYAAIKDLHGSDGCKLEDVRTEKDVMRVEWKKGGVSAPLIEIRPAVCGEGTTVTGPEFSMSAPAGTVEQCPDAVAKLKSLVATEHFGGAVKVGPQTAVMGRRTLFAVGVGAAAALLVVVALVMRRRKA